MSQKHETNDKKPGQQSTPRGLIAVGIGVIILLIIGLVLMIMLLV